MQEAATMANSFDIGAFQKQLMTKEIGKQFIYRDVTGSTMDDAREMAISETQKYPHGTIVMAERQTKARGARDHKWDASNIGNIYVSVVLHMPQKFKTFEGRFELEVIACLAVMKAAGKFDVNQAIPKWPNDVWVRGHKLSGNLVEDSRYNIPGTPLCLLILGMGINVNADIRRNSELHSIATSLVCERHGRPSNREAFFAEVCLALEENLFESRSTILQTFRDENLFQKGCDISVTCPSEGKVINGEFLEVRDNWEVSFRDKRTKEILSGRSDFYTIRPKVVKKILVVFTGASGSKSASVVSRWLTSLVDTSKHVVCLVPESMVTDSDDWMKLCDLLVLVEGICDSTHLTSKLKAYLNRGGRLFASGAAALFVAKFMDIPLKECVLESSNSSTGVSLVYLQHGHSVSQGNAFSPPTQDSGQSSEPITFLASPICYKFSQNFLKEGDTSNSSSVAALLPLASQSDLASLTLSETNGNVSYTTTKEIAASDGGLDKTNNFVLHYCPDEEPDYNVAMFMRPTTKGGIITLCGFDIGVVFPSSHVKMSAAGGSSGHGRGNNSAAEDSKAEGETHKLNNDRFRRDEIILHVLQNFNS